MKSFCPSAIFDYLGGQMGDKTGENLQIWELKIKNLQTPLFMRFVSLLLIKA